MSLDHRSVALTVKGALNRRRRDPLARYMFASPVHMSVAQHVANAVECHHRAANFGGKTQDGAAIAMTFLRDTGELGVGCLHRVEQTASGPVRRLPGTVRMPKFGRATVGACLVSSHDGQVDSSQKALLDWLGDHPHEISYINRGSNVIRTVWVKPDHHRSDDVQTWSRITFFSQENSSEDSIKGQRWDFVWADEPPVEAFWREARKNARYRWITETPIHQVDWEWLQKDFDGPLGVPVKGRVEVLSTIYDNGHLSEQTILEKENEYRGDDHFKARMFGEYVNIDGSCPFGHEYGRLEQLLAWAEPGDEWELDQRVETWREKDPTEDYMVILDPSIGIQPRDGDIGGDACAMWVIAMRAKAGVARYFGWIAPHELARMGLAAAKHYNTALLVPEVNGIGEAMLPIFHGYPNLFREYALERTDKNLSGREGWTQTEQSKAACVASLKHALAGKWLDIPSAPAIKSLMAIRTDQRGKIVRPAGQNHEDMICLGMAAYLLAHPAYQPAPRYQDKQPTTLREQFEKQLATSMGRRVKARPPSRSGDRWR